MLDTFIRKSTEYLIQNRVIDEDDRDVYEYGFHNLYNNIIDVASIVIISVWLNQVPQTILYHISFVFLRNTAGGYHAKTHLQCFIISSAIWLTSLLAISKIGSPGVCISLAALSTSLIWLKGPVEHESSPMSLKKRRRMKV